MSPDQVARMYSIVVLFYANDVCSFITGNLILIIHTIDLHLLTPTLAGNTTTWIISLFTAIHIFYSHVNQFTFMNFLS